MKGEDTVILDLAILIFVPRINAGVMTPWEEFISILIKIQWGCHHVVCQVFGSLYAKLEAF